MDNPPAFPSGWAGDGENKFGREAMWDGMSLRDYFAAQLSANLFNGREYTVGKGGFNPGVYEAVAREAYRFADAMLAARSST